jgi:hypothetical protein
MAAMRFGRSPAWRRRIMRGKLRVTGRCHLGPTAVSADLIGNKVWGAHSKGALKWLRRRWHSRPNPMLAHSAGDERESPKGSAGSSSSAKSRAGNGSCAVSRPPMPSRDGIRPLSTLFALRGNEVMQWSWRVQCGPTNSVLDSGFESHPA